LMRKYHPDLAGGDEARAQQLHERAKALNQAYAVLRDETQRAMYDGLRLRQATRPPLPPRAAAPVADVEREIESEYQYEPELVVQTATWWPLSALGTAYFLLPGAYEWDPGSRREALFTWLIPPFGVLTWLTMTGRLTPWLGASPLVTGAVCLLAISVLAVVHSGSALRVFVGGGLLLALASGVADATLRTAAIPVWFAWLGVGLVSVALAARHVVFGILPTLALCWLIARFGGAVG
jgi:hypothetical protein